MSVKHLNFISCLFFTFRQSFICFRWNNLPNSKMQPKSSKFTKSLNCQLLFRDTFHCTKFALIKAFRLFFKVYNLSCDIHLSVNYKPCKHFIGLCTIKLHQFHSFLKTFRNIWKAEELYYCQRLFKLKRK